MNNIKIVKKYKIEVVTPIHIGSGNILQKDIDYIVKDGFTYFIDKNKVFSHFSIEELKNIYNVSNLRTAFEQLFKKYGIEKFVVLKSNTLPKNEVKEFILDPYGNPFIPGSSLKGAIRTIILKNISMNKIPLLQEALHKTIKRTNENKRKPKNPGSEIESKILRLKEGDIRNIIEKRKKKKINRIKTGPHFDVGRTLIVRDINFNKKDMDLFIVKVFSKKGELEGLTISVLALKPGSQSVGEVIVDEFLLKEIFSSFNERIKNLEDEIRKYSLDWIEKERNKLKLLMIHSKTLERTFESVLGFYKEVSERLKNGEILLHLGYGIGWRGMTGDILELAEPGQRKEILRVFLSVKDEDFPVSRRFIEMPDKTFAPMGWIKLKGL